MTDPQAILAEIHSHHIWTPRKKGPAECWSADDEHPCSETFTTGGEYRRHVATVQAAALAEWLQTFRDKRLDDRDIFCPECDDNGLTALADEFGATP